MHTSTAKYAASQVSSESWPDSKYSCPLGDLSLEPGTSFCCLRAAWACLPRNSPSRSRCVEAVSVSACVMATWSLVDTKPKRGCWPGGSSRGPGSSLASQAGFGTRRKIRCKEGLGNNRSNDFLFAHGAFSMHCFISPSQLCPVCTVISPFHSQVNRGVQRCRDLPTVSLWLSCKDLNLVSRGLMLRCYPALLSPRGFQALVATVTASPTQGCSHWQAGFTLHLHMHGLFAPVSVY